MPDVSSIAPADVRLWVALDVHKFSIVAATLPPSGGDARGVADRDDRAAIRRFIDRLGGPDGPGGLLRGRARRVRAVAAADASWGWRATWSRRRWSRSAPATASRPTAATRRSSSRCTAAGCCASCAADAGDRRAPGPAALPRGSALRADRGASSRRQAAAAARPDLPRRQEGLDATPPRVGRAPAPRRPARAARAGADARSTSTASSASSTRSTRAWSRSPRASAGRQVESLTRFRGISTLTALGLIAEIGDFARFSHPRELASWLGITASEYSSGDQQHRGHITKAGNRHARRLLIEAAWHYRHPPRRPDQRPAARRARLAGPGPPASPLPPPHRARQAPHRHQRRDRPRARRLPVGRNDRPTTPTTTLRRLTPPRWGRATGATAGGPSIVLCDPDSRL